MTRRARAFRGVTAMAATAVLLVACDSGGEEQPPAATEESPSPADGDDPVVDPAPTLPDVATIDPDEVDPDAAPDTLDGAIASAAADLPDTWSATVVPDPGLGPYVLGLPDGATVWRVGEDVSPLEQAASDDAWTRYWQPILTAANEAGEDASLRAAVVLPPRDGEAELHLTISATPQQDLPVGDPDALAASFADTFRQQQLTVEAATTARAGDTEVAALALTTPDDEFDDGVARRLRQWFYPEVDTSVLWSVTCEGPAPAADHVDEVCPEVLGSFRTPPR